MVVPSTAPYLDGLCESPLFFQSDNASVKTTFKLFEWFLVLLCRTNIVPCVAYDGSPCSSKSSCAVTHPHAANLLDAFLRDTCTEIFAFADQKTRFQCLIRLTAKTYDSTSSSVFWPSRDNAPSSTPMSGLPCHCVLPTTLEIGTSDGAQCLSSHTIDTPHFAFFNIV